MYIKAISRIFERLVQKHNEKGESFRTETKEYLDNVLCGEFGEWTEADEQEPYDKENEIDELCDIIIASIIMIEWLIQGGQWLKDISGRTPNRGD